MKLKGLLNINRVSGGEVVISLTDEGSRCQFVEISMSKVEFANALFSLGDRPCVFDFYDNAPIGKIREHKREPVWVPDGPWEKREATAREAIRPHEVNGWEGRHDDAMNIHNRIRDKAPDDAKGAWYEVEKLWGELSPRQRTMEGTPMSTGLLWLIAVAAGIAGVIEGIRRLGDPPTRRRRRRR